MMRAGITLTLICSGFFLMTSIDLLARSSKSGRIRHRVGLRQGPLHPFRPAPKTFPLGAVRAIHVPYGGP